MENQIDKLRQGRDRLRAALASQAPAAEKKVKIIERLEQLLNKSEIAVQIAQESVEEARRHMQNLKGMRMT